MARLLPSLTAVRAFEAAARNGGFSRAAAELHVTPTAVSQQVKVLEEQLGVQLFRRLPRGLALTREGTAYLPELTEGLDRIAKASAVIQKDRFTGTVTLAALPSMVVNWLIPRLANFAQRLPDIRLRLHASTDMSVFASENVDIAIRYFDGAMPGMHVEFLTDEDIFQVCSPKLLNRGPPLHTLRDLRNFDLLHDIDGFRRQPWIGWPTWLADVNEDELMARSGFVFTDSLSMIHAALNGLGVALGRSALLGDLLVSGELVRPMRMCRKAEFRYYLVTPEHRADEPPLRAVCQWLKDRIAVDYEIARH